MSAGVEIATVERASGARPAGSRSYPWYDSVWLEQYRCAQEIIASAKPAALGDFRRAMAVFHTRPEFSTARLRPFDAAQLAEIRAVIAGLAPAELEFHEARTFRRYVVHDHPVFTRLQREAAALVEEAAGEALEPCYNFLSLYAASGVCPMHLDAPFAKWTLDVCIDQAVDWPIYVSRVQPWDTFLEPARFQPGWQERLQSSPQAGFETFVHGPGEALLFSGTSQWHYRDPMPATSARHGATLLFLHYIPRGTAQLVRPESWAERFGVPELAQVGTADEGLPRAG